MDDPIISWSRENDLLPTSWSRENDLIFQLRQLRKDNERLREDKCKPLAAIQSIKQEAETGLVIGDEIGMRDALVQILHEANEHLGIKE